MTAQTRSVPNIPAPIIIGAALLAALVVGWAFAGEGRIPIGLAIVLGAVYVPLVFLDYPSALAVWVGIVYLAHLEALSIAPNAIGVLLVVGWLAGGVVVTKSDRIRVLDQHRGLVTAVVLFAVWLGLSRIWTEDPGVTDIEVTYWQGPLLFLIVAMTISAMRHVQIIAIAMIVGAGLSVLVSLAIGDPGAAAVDGRLTGGGGGDPNTLAAGYVAAIFLAGGLLSVVRGRGSRVALLAMMALATFGFFATQSRGGLIAIGIAAVLALIFTPRYRGRLLGLVAVTGAGLAVFLSSNPEALKRLTQTEDGGSGREDLWTVGWRVFQDNPVLGVGLNNFTEIAPRYVLEPGPLTYVDLVAESPHIVHNTYLQLLAETGIVGLTIFFAVVLVSLRSAWLAARRFDQNGQYGHANLARAVLTGTIGMLVAMVFISIVTDPRIWMLFALGPVMLTIARSGHGELPVRRRDSGRASP